MVSNWDKLMKYLNAVPAREKVEQFRVIFLDARNRILGDEMLCRGTARHTYVYPRQVLIRALELHATASFSCTIIRVVIPRRRGTTSQLLARSSGPPHHWTSWYTTTSLWEMGAGLVSGIKGY